MVEENEFERAAAAVRSGDVSALGRLLDGQPGLATARQAGPGARTLLHVATDWPGHFPEVAAAIAALVAAGADPDAPFRGEHAETPLHWAASSGDLAALAALLDAGADTEAAGGVIGGGTPMADATAFAQWDAARMLLAHGARTSLFDCAALGLVEQVRAMLAAGRAAPDEVSDAFWGACHGGRLATAAVLLEHGARVDRVGWDGLTPLGAARRSGADDVVSWLEQLT